MTNDKSTITISIKRYMLYQCSFTLFLVAAYIVLSITIVSKHDFSFRFFRFFDLDSEMNLPTFFSTVLILINALLFYVLWLLKHSDKEPRVVWLFFSLVFVFLAMDEYCSIHEKVGVVFRYILHLPAKGYIYLTWVVPYGLLVGLISFYFYKFWRQLTPYIKWWFFISAFTFLLGSVGFEMVGERIAQQYSNADISYKIVMILEESLEMVGQILLEYTLLKLIRQDYASPVLHIAD
jgi:hypothetical protein